MKFLKTFFTTLLLLTFLIVNVNAQGRRGKQDWDKFRAEKISFLTEKLELTPEEAQKFWPVYNLFEKERGELFGQKREIEKKFRDDDISLSDKEIIKLIDKMVAMSQAETDLMKKYNKELLEVIPPQKVLILFNMEHEFRMHMLNKYRSGKDKK